MRKYRVESEITLIGGKVIKYVHEHVFTGATPEEMCREYRRYIANNFLMSDVKIIRMKKRI